MKYSARQLLFAFIALSVSVMAISSVEAAWQSPLTAIPPCVDVNQFLADGTTPNPNYRPDCITPINAGLGGQLKTGDLTVGGNFSVGGLMQSYGLIVGSSTLILDTGAVLDVDGKIKITGGNNPGVGKVLTATTSPGGLNEGLAEWHSISSTSVASTTVTLLGSLDNGPSLPGPLTATAGQKLTLNWSAANAVSCFATGSWPTIGSVAATVATSSVVINPLLAANASPTLYTYSLICAGLGGTTATGLKIIVSPPPKPFVDLKVKVNSGPVVDGPVEAYSSFDTMTLSWTTNNVASCVASGDWSGTQPTSSIGQPVGFPGSNGDRPRYVYVITCTDAQGGKASDQVIVTANPADGNHIALDFTANGAFDKVDVNPGTTVTLNWFTNPAAVNCTGTEVDYGGSPNLGWTGLKASGGSQLLSLGGWGAYEFKLECEYYLSSGGVSSEKRVFVNILDPNDPATSPNAVHLNVNGSHGPVVVDAGQALNFSWTASGYTPGACNFEDSVYNPYTDGHDPYSLPTNYNGGNLPLAGSLSASAPSHVVSLWGNYTYYLDCRSNNNDNVNSDRVIIQVRPVTTVDLKINGQDGPISATTSQASIPATLSWVVTSSDPPACYGNWSPGSLLPLSGSADISITPPSGQSGSYVRNYILNCQTPGDTVYVGDSVRVNVTTTHSPPVYDCTLDSGGNVVCQLASVWSAVTRLFKNIFRPLSASAQTSPPSGWRVPLQSPPNCNPNSGSNYDSACVRPISTIITSDQIKDGGFGLFSFDGGKNLTISNPTKLTKVLTAVIAGDIDNSFSTTTTPTLRLDIRGQLRVRGGAPVLGNVLTSDAGGLASWLPLGGAAASRPSVDVKVGSQDGPVVLPSNPNPGVTISWSASHFTTCVKSGTWQGTISSGSAGNVSDSLTPATNGLGVYNLTCTNAAGTTADSVEVIFQP